MQIKWFLNSDVINQLPKDDPNLIPHQNPCILVDKYTVFIIGGQNKNNEFLNFTWMAEFDVVPDQVK